MKFLNEPLKFVPKFHFIYVSNLLAGMWSGLYPFLISFRIVSYSLPCRKYFKLIAGGMKKVCIWDLLCMANKVYDIRIRMSRSSSRTQGYLLGVVSTPFQGQPLYDALFPVTGPELTRGWSVRKAGTWVDPPDFSWYPSGKDIYSCLKTKAPSSRGLGLSPFKAATRVQIPSGPPTKII